MSTRPGIAPAELAELRRQMEAYRGGNLPLRVWQAITDEAFPRLLVEAEQRQASLGRAIARYRRDVEDYKANAATLRKLKEDGAAWYDRKAQAAAMFASELERILEDRNHG